ncbi:MAG: hypothetical protein Q8L14_40770 [Myxococcales bacterium]|nr:hypothetical protein [Myxococcales bacterium]
MGRVLVLLLLGGSTTSAAASSVLVVGENERGREVAAELSEVFAKQKVKMKVAGPQAPATSCLFRPASERGRCFSQAGQTAFVDAVLQVGATTAKGRTTVTFQLLSLDDGRVIKREVATGPSNNLGKALTPVITRLAKLIKPQAGGSKAPEKVEPEKTAPEPVVTAPEPVKTTPVQPSPDVPKKTVLEPVVVAPPPSIVAPVEPKGSGLTVAAWTTTGLAVAAAGVACTFGVMGLNARGELDKNEGGVSALSRSQANALAGQANTNYSVALGAGIGAGVLGVVSAILWSQTP